jgi:SAM-dependent methyltransferase
MPDEHDLTQRALQSWEGVSHGWEQNRRRVFEAFRQASEWLVQALDPQPGQTILELAAGPGETGFLAADRLGADGRLISTDLSPGMVEAAQRGADERGLANVECRVMDAQQLDLADDSLDGALSRLGLMLVPDPARAFSELRRTLRDGGRLAYAVIGSPMANQWMGIAMMAFVQRGHLPAGGDPFGPGGPFSLADPDRNQQLLRAAGFDQVEVTDLQGTMPFESPEDYWGLQSSIAGPLADMASSLPADEVEEIRTSLGPSMEPFATAGGYDLPFSLVAVSAR